MVEGTLAAWLEAIEGGRSWDEERDTPRIRRAFLTLAQTARRWPSVPEFLDALPKFEPPKALAATPADPARAQRMIAQVQALLNPRVALKPEPVTERIDLGAAEAQLAKHYADRKSAAGGDS